MYVNVDHKQSIRFIDGWLEHQIADNSWQRYWCVLRDDVIFLFSSQKECRDTMVGSIAIGPESKLEKLAGDERNGFTFRLCTTRSSNNFKIAKTIDREMWKACVEGITNGDVSNDIDLLPGLIEDVRSKLKQYFMNRPPVIFPRKVSIATSLKTGFDTPDNSTSGSYDSTGYLIPNQRRPSINPVLQEYRFHSDQSRTDVPSWFFSSCSREMAEQILRVGEAYGNTLLRESTSSTKNLVISKLTEPRAGNPFTHYIIQTTPRGYKICVENPHEPKETLAELIEFFIETSGRKTTRLMTCNDLKKFGIESYIYNDYNKKIEKNCHDPDSGEEIGDAEVGELFLNPSNRGAPISIAPPPPHIPKSAKQPNTKVTDLHGGWNVRSTSVPNIQHQLGLLEQLQAAKPFQVPSKSSDSQPSHILRTNKEIKESAVKFPLPPIPQKSPLRPNPAVPALPPNHPPPLQKAHSQSTIKIIPVILDVNTKKTTPKHTQSVSSADIQVRQTSPRDHQSASKAQDELAQITARIIKQTEPQETPSKQAESAKPEVLKDVLKSHGAASDSFKKKLEGLIRNPLVGAAKPRLQSETADADDCYESVSHYQNFNVIPNFRN